MHVIVHLSTTIVHLSTTISGEFTNKIGIKHVAMYTNSALEVKTKTSKKITPERKNETVRAQNVAKHILSFEEKAISTNIPVSILL